MLRRSFLSFTNNSSNQKKKLVIVTGSSKPFGIGAHLVKRFLEQEGTFVSTCDLAPFDRSTIASWMQTVASIQEKNGEVEPLYVESACDITQEAQIERFFRETRDSFDLTNVSSMTLINNAAIANPYMPQVAVEVAEEENEGETSTLTPFSLQPPPLASLNINALHHYLNVNVIGQALAMKYFAKFLLSDKKNLSSNPIDASVINISSTRSLMSEPNCEGYAASKGALESLTHATALTNSATNAQRVRVNAIRLGWISCANPNDSNKNEHQPTRRDHNFHPSGKVGEPEDVFAMCDFLADGTKSGFVNGQTLTLDGGVTKKMIYPDEGREE